MKRSVGGVVAALIVPALVGLPQPVTAKASCADPSASGGEWTMMHYDYRATRHQDAENEIGPAQAATLAPVWTFSANNASGESNNEITGYPIVADGCVYIGSSTGNGAPGWLFSLNADTGEVVWKKKVSNGVYSTLAVANGRVFAHVSRVSKPYVLAVDQDTGKTLWQTTVDTQEGSDAVSSPIVYKGMVWVGVSGTAAEGAEEETRVAFQGNFVLLEEKTGKIIKKTYTIPPRLWEEGYAGGAMWSTISIDPDTDYGYIGTGNPFNYDSEHDRTNAVVKVDLDRKRKTFGEIVDSYKGNVEEYFPEASGIIPCEGIVAGLECARLDVDFGATPNIFEDSEGRTVVGAGQKSGVYHAFFPEKMKRAWTSLLGVPSAVGGIVGTAAHDGEALYGPHTLVGYIWSIDENTGERRWVTPLADGVHWGNPTTSANGVIYTNDFKGFLNALDAQTGVPLLAHPMSAETREDPSPTWGAVTVARHTIYSSIGVGATSAGAMFPSMPDGFVIAYQPQV